jgi:hypothetical protein
MTVTSVNGALQLPSPPQPSASKHSPTLPNTAQRFQKQPNASKNSAHRGEIANFFSFISLSDFPVPFCS